MIGKRSGRRACAALAEHRSALVDQALGPADRERVLRHLAGCASCRVDVAQLRGLRARLGHASAGQEQPPPPLTGRLLAIAGTEVAQPLWTSPFDRGRVRPLPRRRHRTRWASAAGALVLAGVVVGVGIAAAPPPLNSLADPTRHARTEFGAVAAQLPLSSEPLSAVLLSLDALPASPADQPPYRRVSGGRQPLEPEAARAALARATGAADTVSFTGEQRLSAHLGHRSVQVTVRIRSRSGRGSVMHVYDGSERRIASTYLPATFASRLPDATQAVLLADNYTLAGWRGAEVVGRAATLVEARRPSVVTPSSASTGPVAARWWIDDATGLLLWFESYDEAERVTVSAGFTRLVVREPEVADHVPPRMFVPLTTTSLTLSAATGLEELGWACPEQLAGLTLVRLRTDVIDRPSVVHMAYSDGLSTVSVFEQRGSLDRAPQGEWRPDLGAWVSPGTPAVATWQSGNTAFTVVTDGSPDLLAGVVRALPHEIPVATTTMDRVRAGWARILDLVTG